MKLKTILLTLTFIFGISNTSFADFEDGLTAYNSGDYTKAFQEWKILAEDGQVRAQYNIAWMHAYGVGTLKDYQASVGWYMKAAEQGYVHAQYNLANTYLRGDVRLDNLLRCLHHMHASRQHCIAPLPDHLQQGLSILGML